MKRAVVTKLARNLLHVNRRYATELPRRALTSTSCLYDTNQRNAAEWKDQAKVVIAGGGCVGTALAYILAKKGVSDVILLEKSELTAGSTWHAAGLVTYFNGAINLKKAHYFAINTLDTIEKETGQAIGFHKPGSLRLAETPTRMDEMKYQLSRSQWHPAPIELIGPERIHELHPLLNMDKILGGLWNPDDGHVDPYSLTMAYAAGAKAKGARILQHCEVTATNLKEDGRWEVETNHGRIMTDHFVNAGGLWARELGKLAGLTLPIIPAHHQFVITTSLPEVQALDKEVPVVRDLDGSYYLRQERDGLLYGPYEPPEKMQLCDDWYDNGPPEGFGRELFQPDLDRISASSEKAMELTPCLETANIQTVVSGPITYGPDVLPQVGPYPGLRNYWVSVAHTYGIVHSSGLADYLSDWMLTGEPPYECIDTDPARFCQSWVTEKFHLAKARETYGMNNQPPFPKEVRFAGRPTSRVTPIYERQKAAGAQFSISAGWETADWYALSGDEAGYKPSFRRTNWFEPVGRECRGVIENCGVIDLTSFGKFEVSGPDSERFIDHIYANDVPKLGETKVSHMLTSRGTIHAEHTVTRMPSGNFWCITGGGSEIHDLRWMQTVADKEGMNVSFTNMSDDYGVVSVAGPKARDVLSRLTDKDVSAQAWPFMTEKDIELGGVKTHAFRLSYTGELGWELFVKRDEMATLYDAVVEAGKGSNMVKFGKFALDSLRQEKGMRGWGGEMTRDLNALEAGLGMFLKMNKSADFVGKAALHKLKAEGLKRKLVFMTVDTTDVDPEGNETIWSDGKVVGFTTSGSYGWQVGASVCMGYLPVDLANSKDKVQVELLGKRCEAKVYHQPLIKHETRR